MAGLLVVLCLVGYKLGVIFVPLAVCVPEWRECVGLGFGCTALGVRCIARRCVVGLLVCRRAIGCVVCGTSGMSLGTCANSIRSSDRSVGSMDQEVE